MLMHMAAIPFLLAVPIIWLLLPAIQAQPGFFGYPDAVVPTRWTNSQCMQHAVNFTDGSAVRAILLVNL